MRGQQDSRQVSERYTRPWSNSAKSVDGLPVVKITPARVHETSESAASTPGVRVLDHF